MKNIVDKIMQLAARETRQAEVILVEGQEAPVDFRSGKLHSVEHKSLKGAGLRIIKDGRIGFSSTTDFSKLEELVKHATESARFGQPARFELPGKCAPRKVKTFDREVEGLSTARALSEGRKAIAKLARLAPAFKCDAAVNRKSFQVTLANSRGFWGSYKKTSFNYYIGGVAVIGGSLLFAGDSRRGSRLRLDTKAMTDKIALLYRQAKRTGRVQSGPTQVLFMPEAMELLWSSIALGVNGKNAQKKSSPLIGREGQPVLDPRLTVTDDPFLPLGLASVPFDDEGVCGGPRQLFSQGVFTGFVYDLQTAGMMGTQSTGHAGRDYHTQPVPKTSNLMISAGKTRLEELIAGMDRGIIVYDLLGAGQSNILAGDFSANIGLGFTVEKGKVTGRVKDAMVAGNAYDLLRNKLVEASSELTERGTVTTPAMLFKDVSIAAK